MKKKRLIHDYPSCSRTYATLCVYHKSAEPKIVTDILKIRPDSVKMVEGKTETGLRSGWFLYTQNRNKLLSTSRDMRTHVEWLLNRLNNKKSELQKLCKLNFILYISCFWESASGNGGPLLDPKFIKRLSEFPIELGFDIYFDLENWK